MYLPCRRCGGGSLWGGAAAGIKFLELPLFILLDALLSRDEKHGKQPMFWVQEIQPNADFDNCQKGLFFSFLFFVFPPETQNQNFIYKYAKHKLSIELKIWVYCEQKTEWDPSFKLLRWFESCNFIRIGPTMVTFSNLIWSTFSGVFFILFFLANMNIKEYWVLWNPQSGKRFTVH